MLFLNLEKGDKIRLLPNQDKSIYGFINIGSTGEHDLSCCLCRLAEPCCITLIKAIQLLYEVFTRIGMHFQFRMKK